MLKWFDYQQIMILLFKRESIPMINKRKPYKTFTREFKVEAVRLMNESDKPASEIATQLGIRRNQLYKWKAQ